MTIIAENDRATIRDLLQREMVADVELLLFTRPRSRIFVPGRQDSQSSEETRELLEELTSLSERLRLTTVDVSANPDAARRYNVTEAPTILLRQAPLMSDGSASHADTSGGAPAEHTAPSGGSGQASGATERPTARSSSADGAADAVPNVRFLGLPAGYEFSTLVADIVDVSRGTTDLSPATVEAVKAIDSPVHIQVFVTPT